MFCKVSWEKRITHSPEQRRLTFIMKIWKIEQREPQKFVSLFIFIIFIFQILEITNDETVSESELDPNE